MSNIGENIRSARIKRGMTQEELAIAVETTKAAISRYELGKREPRHDQLVAIADALNVTTAYLYGSESMEVREVMQAIARGDAREFERLLGLESGSIVDMTIPATEPHPISDEDIKFALFGGKGEVTDDMLDEVRAFAAFVAQREAAKRKKSENQP